MICFGKVWIDFNGFIIYRYLEPNGSIPKILDKLNNELKIPGRKGGLWSSRVVADILTKPLYAPNDMAMYQYLKGLGANITNEADQFDGMASIDMYGKKNANASKHKRTRSADEMYCNISNHEAIIDSDTWLRVQYKHKEQVRKPSRAGTGKNSWFTGLMKCGCCGTGVSYTNSRGTQGYYLCSTKKNRGYYTCEQKPAAKKKTDPIIIQSIINHYTEPSVVNKIKCVKLNTTAKLNPAALKERNDLMLQLAQVDSQINSLIESLTQGNTTLIKYINEKIIELDQEKTAITSQIAKIDSSQSQEQQELALMRQLADVLDNISDVLLHGTFDEIKDLCHILVKKIIFDKDDKITIEYTV